MRCELFRADPPALIDALCDADLLRRYLDAHTAELPALADRQLAAHLRRLSAQAAQVLAVGMVVQAKRDAPGLDALLTDVFAVATWHGWSLPVEALGAQEVEPGAIPRGLLRADPGAEGAGLWVLDHATIALARLREAGEAEWGGQHR